MRIVYPQAKFATVALRQKRKSKKQDSELEQPAQWSGSGEFFNDSSDTSVDELRRALEIAYCSATFFDFLQALDTHMTSKIDDCGNFLSDHVRAPSPPDRRLHALRHRDGMGKNGRFHRRG